MALEHPSAPARPAVAVPSGTPRSGVVHVNLPHARHFTVVGNHLVQHRQLSATAIGVAAYIQSLPGGAPVGIKALAERFPEGEIRIANALRELERHGYLERRRVRLATGQVVTCTYSYNNPGAPADPPPPPPLPEKEPVRGPEPEPEPRPGAESESAPGPWPESASEPPALAGVRPEAAAVLAGLRRHDPRLLLSERDVQRLAPGVSRWLDRGADPESIARALSGDLPEDLRHPAGMVAHRLAALLPPHLPAAPVKPPVRRPDPFQTCDGCDRAFRAPEPGRCRDCPPAAA